MKTIKFKNKRKANENLRKLFYEMKKKGRKP